MSIAALLLMQMQQEEEKRLAQEERDREDQEMASRRCVFSCTNSWVTALTQNSYSTAGYFFNDPKKDCGAISVKPDDNKEPECYNALEIFMKKQDEENKGGSV